ncbi:trimethylamine methyltransferase family protein [Candidatus Bathyarchaeota archaeon]|jgi:trimethylamine--corrinoid protein Co-methyltransferase|nr:trimethylamine methyltransferase family protein [Candidatus Bathyarchaeota archaeon]
MSFSSQPLLQLLSREEIETIHLSSLKVLEEVGVMIQSDAALKLVADAGVDVDASKKIARIPQHLVKESLVKAPSTIRLYSRDGKHDILLEGNRVHYDPGSAALYLLDSRTGEIRRPVSKDLADFVRLADALDNIHAQSTALVVSDVPDAIVDRYRLYVVLKNSPKPIVTGTFSIDGLYDMKDMLAAVVGGEKELARKPMAIFDLCPSAPFKWGEFIAQNLIDCAKYGIPAEILPMPQLGATGPVTLAGSLVQLNAEFLSGLVLSQLANPGAPVIYGGSPTTFDMRYLTARLGAIETIMMGCAYAQMAKYYGLPTHMYLGLSDTKIVDAQAGFESGLGITLGALAGVNMMSGPGMLDFENCQSFEKLVIDDTICGMALRLIKGIDVNDQTLAVDAIRRVGVGGHYLADKHTMEWFKKELLIPSDLVDRQNLNAWKKLGSKDTVQRARDIVQRILKDHKPDPLPADIEKNLDDVARKIMRKHGVDKLPLGPA